MDNLLLKIKHWQVFVFLAAINFFSMCYAGNSLLSVYISISLLVGYIGWYALLGNTLCKYLPRKINYNVTWFLFDVLLIITAFGMVGILSNGYYEVSGLLVIPFIYLFFAVFHLYWFPAVLLVSIETKSKPEFSQYAGTMLQLVFWPLGIWFIQPRLNKIYNSIQADTLAYPRP